MREGIRARVGLGRFRASPQGLRLLQHAVDRTLILAGGLVAHRAAGPASPTYTPERNQILGIFAVSKLAEVTEGYVLGNAPYATTGRSTFAPPIGPSARIIPDIR